MSELAEHVVKARDPLGGSHTVGSHTGLIWFQALSVPHPGPLALHLIALV